jgi:transposase-like protein
MQPNSEGKEQPILSLIQQIKDGSLNLETIDKEVRQQCVEVFLGEGYTVSSIAQIFEKCEKTIRRDIEEIRERNALTPDVNLAKKTIGEMVTYAKIHRDYLMRLARIKDASVAEKSQAEYLAARVGLELIGKMQSLGYLPSKPTAIVGDVFHHFNGDDMAGMLDEISKQVIEVEKIASETGVIPKEIEGDLSEVKGFIKKAENLKKERKE